MINKNTKKITGYLFLVIGGLALGKQLNLWSFSWAYRGWWTWLITIPFGFELLTKRFKLTNLIGLVVGLLFLFQQWEVLKLQAASLLLLPLAVLSLGLVYIIDR